MTEHGWQWQKKVAVTNGTPEVVSLPIGRPLLEKLTIWASSGARTLTNMSCQPRLNGVNFGAATNIAGAPAATLVFDSEAEGHIMPHGLGTMDAPDTRADPFDFDVLVTNTAVGTTESITLYFAAVGRDGGPQ